MSLLTRNVPTPKQKVPWMKQVFSGGIFVSRRAIRRKLLAIRFEAIYLIAIGSNPNSKVLTFLVLEALPLQPRRRCESWVCTVA